MDSSFRDLRDENFIQLDLPVFRRLESGDNRLKKIRKRVGKIVEKFNSSEGQAEKMLQKYTRKFDGVESADFKIPPEELEQAASRINPKLLESLKLAETRIRAHYELEAASGIVEESADGLKVKSRVLPVESCAVYVPGGGARYPSSLLMNAIPAQVAGVKKIVVCTPPSKASGQVPDEVLAAGYLLGIQDIYAVGGAQAIGALAFGTTSIPRVDLICGPGNDYVAQAMKLVSSLGMVKVPASYAGPSEIAILLERNGLAGSENMQNLALDIQAQLEHGEESWAWIVTWEEGLYEELLEALNSSQGTSSGGKKSERIYGYLVEDLNRALEFINLSAPEHLQIISEEAENLADRVKNAGAVFCGVPTALGDYIAGPSHTLPTGGSARFAGALSCRDFQKTIHIISEDSSKSQEAYQELYENAAVIASAEGFKMHEKSLRGRIKGD